MKETKTEKLAILRRFTSLKENFFLAFLAILAIYLPIFGNFSKPLLLPRCALLWDDSTIYLGEIDQLSTIGRFFFPSNVDCDLKICEYALHVVVEKVSAGSKQERKGEAEYHLKLGKWFLWK